MSVIKVIRDHEEMSLETINKLREFSADREFIVTLFRSQTREINEHEKG